MLKLIIVFVAVGSFAAHALEKPRHLIGVGTDGFGWSGLAITHEKDEQKSNIKDQSTSVGRMDLNYHYLWSNGWMLGAELRYTNISSEYKRPNTDEKIESEYTETAFGVSVGYNFNEDFYRSWWVKAVFGGGSERDREQDATSTETDNYRTSSFGLAVGKRFSLESWGLRNVTYAPSISWTRKRYSGSDADRDGLEATSQGRIDLLRLDILF
jgi:hypothetical protein